MDALSGLNTFISVWMGLWIIPAAITQGDFRNIVAFVNIKTSLYFLFLLLMNTIVMLPAEGWSGYTLIKVLVLSLLPFLAAYFMLRFYHARIPNK
ncbi:MAG: hypothetical protein Q7L07_11710 [Pseudohongiella sp.]|nr:hypothetical protein [Pseudohongiella sp.]MDP2285763.1 hypothetical protein [Pseudohongiella sp.]